MAELSQTAANVVASDGAVVRTVTAGGTVTAGMPVYKDTADANQYKASKADALATALIDGIALNGASDNQPLEVIESGDVNLGATLVPGEVYGVSANTTGKIWLVSDYATASSDYPVIVGVAFSASICRLALRAGGVVR